MINERNGFILNAESFWTPTYRISPFNTSYVRINNAISKRENFDSDLLNTVFGKCYCLVKNGKSAINIALSMYNLNSSDEVWIVTTSDNLYISSCVTDEISKYCSWNRKKTDKTKLIFINHEFGFCRVDIPEFRKYHLPIIEDRALSFYSKDDSNTTGTIGDYVIYSAPKIFPINFGGILQSNVGSINQPIFEGLVLLRKLLTFYLRQSDQIKKKRLENYTTCLDLFAAQGLKPVFDRSNEEIPGVFLFQLENFNLPGLKLLMHKNGVEASVFYGREAFFVPCHQGLESEDFKFFLELIKYFKISENK